MNVIRRLHSRVGGEKTRTCRAYFLEYDGPRFTMVELLVTLAIVSLLAAWILPMMARGRDAARHARCLAQLHQLGVAFGAYQNDFQGYLPPINRWNARAWRISGASAHDMDKSHPDVALGWPVLLGGLYLDSGLDGDLPDDRPVFQCPFDTPGRRYAARGGAVPLYGNAAKRPAGRLSYTRPKAEGVDDSLAPFCDDEPRLATYFWPYRPLDGRCRTPANPSPSCGYACADRARFVTPRQVMLLAENHENIYQIQDAWNAQTAHDQWWTFLRTPPEKSNPATTHWTLHRGGKAAVSGNGLMADGHASNFTPDERPHLRWRLTKRPRGFPPRGFHPAAQPYGFLPDP